MLYEYLLISVVIACGYWGWFFVRRQPTGTPTFGVMQLAAAGLAGLGLLGRWRYDEPLLGLAGAIGLGAGVCLMVVGPLLRWGARKLAAAERLGAAGRLLDLAEILAPGSGVAEEKAVLGAMREIRDGRIEQTVEALIAAKERAPAEARLAIDERIALLYLAAYRWQEAISHAETHLFGAVPAGEGEAVAAVVEGDAGSEGLTEAARAAGGEVDAPREDAAEAARAAGPPGSLRRQLGVAPPVWVELLGAYGRTGDMDRAADMLARLEDVCAGRDDAAMWIHRARVMFLALAGRPAAVKALVEPRRSRHMSPAARTYWMAVAHEHDGDRAAATEAYERARQRTRGRPRELIDQALTRLGMGIEPAALSPAASAVVARIEAAPLPAPVRLPRQHRPWATWALTGTLLGVAGGIALGVGPTGDLGVLVRAGAMVRSLVDHGEWWRLVSCVFVHVGAVHLIVNVIGMFFLGRVAEELFGGPRTVVVFGAAGVAGAAASYAAGPAGISAGASGAIFGLLGAVFMELTLHRDRYRAAWKRGLWGGIAVVTVAQVGVGFLYPVIDQWAHGAGLAAGTLLGALLSPHARWAAFGRYAGRALALMFAAFALAAAVLVARTSIADSYGDLPRRRHVLNGVALSAPASWHAAGVLVDPDRLIEVKAAIGAGDPRGQIAGVIEKALAEESQRSQRTRLADASIIPLPAGWEGSEIVETIEDPMGVEQRFRVILAARSFGGQLVVVSITMLESMARAAPEIARDLLASAGPA